MDVKGKEWGERVGLGIVLLSMLPSPDSHSLVLNRIILLTGREKRDRLRDGIASLRTRWYNMTYAFIFVWRARLTVEATQ